MGVKQRSGYGIFLKSHKLAAWYEQSLARNETSDPARILKDSSFPQRSSYRGIFRLPLIAWPSSDSPSAGAATEREDVIRMGPGMSPLSRRPGGPHDAGLSHLAGVREP